MFSFVGCVDDFTAFGTNEVVNDNGFRRYDFRHRVLSVK